MTKYYTVTTPDTGKDGKTRFHKVGVAFPQNEGAKSFMTIQLFANPLNGELVLFEPKPDSDDGKVTEGHARGGASRPSRCTSPTSHTKDRHNGTSAPIHPRPTGRQWPR